MIYKKAPMSNATLVKHRLEESKRLKEEKALQESSINLYEENKLSDYEQRKQIISNHINNKKNLSEARETFSNTLLEELVSSILFDGILYPVLEMNYANNHQYQLGYNLANGFAKKHNCHKLIDEWSNSNYYMQCMSEDVSNWHKHLLQEADEKIKEGLSLKDAYQIEEDSINKFIFTIKDNIPKDIDKTIMDRVSDSVQEFIDDNKKNKADMERVYMDTKAKMMQDEDPQIQQECVRIAKVRENEILKRPTNVFGEMTKIMLESVHKISVLKESYSDNNNKLDFKKLIKDTEVMYTFLECLNTLNIIKVDRDFILDTLNEMKNSIDTTAENVKEQMKNAM